MSTPGGRGISGGPLDFASGGWASEIFLKFHTLPRAAYQAGCTLDRARMAFRRAQSLQAQCRMQPRPLNFGGRVSGPRSGTGRSLARFPRPNRVPSRIAICTWHLSGLAVCSGQIPRFRNRIRRSRRNRNLCPPFLRFHPSQRQKPEVLKSIRFVSVRRRKVRLNSPNRLRFPTLPLTGAGKRLFRK